MDWRHQASARPLPSCSRLHRQTENSTTPVTNSPVLYPFNAVDTSIILDVMKPYIRAYDLIQYRHVSKQFIEIVQDYPQVSNHLVFHIAGNHPKFKSANSASAPNPIQILTQSTFVWNHVKFSQVNLEVDFMRHEDLYRKFTRQISMASLKSLTLIECYCEMGSFMEMISFCYHLTELKIINCPSIFQTGFGIITCHIFIPGFFERIRQLEDFTLMDTRRNGSVVDACTTNLWVYNMDQLVSLDVRSSFGYLPIESLVAAITRNWTTLLNLTIVGTCKMTEELIADLTQIRLKSLCLGNISLESYNALNGFLHLQKNTLESLHFYNMTIHVDSIHTIAKFRKLFKLHLEDTHFVGGLMTQDPKDPHPLAKLKHLKDLRLQNSLKVSCFPWISLLKNSESSLTTLVLRFVDVHILVNSFDVQSPCLQGLKTLVVMDLGKNQANFLSRPHLLQPIMRLNTLEKLEITDSDFIDSDFKPQRLFFSDVDGPSLNNLTCLVMLNLSRMAVGDEVLLKYIIRVPSLQALYMDETELSISGLRELIGKKKINLPQTSSNQVLPNLRFLSACRCAKINVTPTIAEKLARNLRLHKFYCDLRSF